MSDKDRLEVKTIIKINDVEVGSITTTLEVVNSDRCKEVINGIRKDHCKTCLGVKFSLKRDDY